MFQLENNLGKKLVVQKYVRRLFSKSTECSVISLLLLNKKKENKCVSLCYIIGVEWVILMDVLNLNLMIYYCIRKRF